MILEESDLQQYQDDVDPRFGFTNYARLAEFILSLNKDCTLSYDPHFIAWLLMYWNDDSTILCVVDKATHETMKSFGYFCPNVTFADVEKDGVFRDNFYDRVIIATSNPEEYVIQKHYRDGDLWVEITNRVISIPDEGHFRVVYFGNYYGLQGSEIEALSIKPDFDLEYSPSIPDESVKCFRVDPNAVDSESLQDYVRNHSLNDIMAKRLEDMLEENCSICDEYSTFRVVCEACHTPICRSCHENVDGKCPYRCEESQWNIVSKNGTKVPEVNLANVLTTLSKLPLAEVMLIDTRWKPYYCRYDGKTIVRHKIVGEKLFDRKWTHIVFPRSYPYRELLPEAVTNSDIQYLCYGHHYDHYFLQNPPLITTLAELLPLNKIWTLDDFREFVRPCGGDDTVVKTINSCIWASLCHYQSLTMKDRVPHWDFDNVIVVLKDMLSMNDVYYSEMCLDVVYDGQKISSKCLHIINNEECTEVIFDPRRCQALVSGISYDPHY